MKILNKEGVIWKVDLTTKTIFFCQLLSILSLLFPSKKILELNHCILIIESVTRALILQASNQLERDEWFERFSLLLPTSLSLPHLQARTIAKGIKSDERRSKVQSIRRLELDETKVVTYYSPFSPSNCH